MVTAWTYPACLMAGNHDGDTISVDIDLGMDLWVKNKAVRLTGVACNELSAPGGDAARAAVAAKVSIGFPLYLVSRGWDKYSGRIDALVYIDIKNSVTLQSWLIQEGWAVAWDGTGKQPIVPFPPVRPHLPERVW